MNSEPHKNIFSETECLSEQQMFDYIDGKLNASEQYQAERHLVDCELCSDALEGLRLVQNRNIISETKQEVQQLVLNHSKKRNYFAYYAIAASVLVIFGLWFIFNPAKEDISKNIAEAKTLNDSSKQIAETNTIVSENKNTDSTPQIASKTNKVAIAMNERKADKKEKEEIMQLNTIVPKKEEIAATATGDEAASGMALAKDEEAAKPVSASEAEPSMATKSSRAEEDVVLRDDAKESAKSDKYETEKAKKSNTRSAAAAPQVAYSLFKPTTLDTTVAVYDMTAQYRDGYRELNYFLKKQLNISKETNKCDKTIYVSFIVNADGNLSDIKIVRPLDECSEVNDSIIEALKLTNKKWIPAKKDGKNIASNYLLRFSPLD